MLETPMSILGRLQNIVLEIQGRITWLGFQAVYNGLMWSHNYELPSISSAINDVEIHLMNTNAYLDIARYRSPNAIQIGGFHIQTPRKLQAVKVM